MSYIGDFAASSVVYGKFTTYRPSTGAPYTLSGTPALSVYKDNSTTQSTSGVTLTADFDSVAGLNHFAIDTSSDGSFYSAGSNFDIVITTGTVDSVSAVGTVVGRFSIANRSALRPTTAGRTLDVTATGEAGIDWANIGGSTTTVNLSGTTVKTATDVETDTSDIQSRIPTALTADGNIKADTLMVAGTAQTAGDIYALLSDVDAEVDLIYGVAQSMAVTGSALVKEPNSNTTITTGTQSSGTYADVAVDNGVYHIITAVGNTIDMYYEYDIGASGVPSKYSISGYLKETAPAGGDTISVYAYNWGGASWDLIMTDVFTGIITDGPDTVHTDNLLSRHVGTGGNDGKVRIRLYSNSLEANTTVNIDMLIVEYAESLSADISSIKTKTDYLPSATAGAAGGVFIAGTNAATSVTTAFTANITGNITGNLSGSVGSVATGGITAASFAAGAINAAAIADAAIDAATFAADVDAEARSWIGLASANLDTQFTAITDAGIKKNTALNNFEFLMTDDTNHAPSAGLTITSERSIDGGAFASCANSASGVANGIYKINLADTDLNGDVITLRFTATNADDRVITIKTTS